MLCIGCRAKHARLGTGERCSARVCSRNRSCNRDSYIGGRGIKPFLPSSSSEAHTEIVSFTRPPCHFGPYSPDTRTLEPGSLRDASPGRAASNASLGRPGGPGLSLCQSYLQDPLRSQQALKHAFGHRHIVPDIRGHMVQAVAGGHMATGD